MEQQRTYDISLTNPVSSVSTVYGADGRPNQSANFNYPYDSYRVFITGNVDGLAYRQRNVFLYPPQYAEQCEVNDGVIGEGVCGTNGNTKIFEADQVAAAGTTDGSISGLFAGLFDTQTMLIGRDNALLYQVFFGDILFQSQLTTLSKGPDGVQRRTRSAQSFNPGTGQPANLSFFRERQVTKEGACFVVCKIAVLFVSLRISHMIVVVFDALFRILHPAGRNHCGIQHFGK